jgi:hypothetical protein
LPEPVAVAHKDVIVFPLACVAIAEQRRQLTLNAVHIHQCLALHDVRSKKKGLQPQKTNKKKKGNYFAGDIATLV